MKFNKLFNFVLLVLFFFIPQWSNIFKASRSLGEFRDNVNLMNSILLWDDLFLVNIYNTGSRLFNYFFIFLIETYGENTIIFFQSLSIFGLFIQQKRYSNYLFSFLVLFNPFVITSFLGNLRNGFSFFLYHTGNYLGKNVFGLILITASLYFHQSLLLVLFIDLLPDYLFKKFLKFSVLQRFLLLILLLSFTFLVSYYFSTVTDFGDNSSNINTSNNQLIIISPWFVYLYFMAEAAYENGKLNFHDVKRIFQVAIFVGISFSVAGYYRYFSFLIFLISNSIFKLEKTKQIIFILSYFIISIILFIKWA